MTPYPLLPNCSGNLTENIQWKINNSMVSIYKHNPEEMSVCFGQNLSGKKAKLSGGWCELLLSRHVGSFACSGRKRSSCCLAKEQALWRTLFNLSQFVGIITSLLWSARGLQQRKAFKLGQWYSTPTPTCKSNHLLSSAQVSLTTSIVLGQRHVSYMSWVLIVGILDVWCYSGSFLRRFSALRSN